MFRRLAALLVFLAAGVVFAQDAPPLGPIGSFDAGNFRALAVTSDGSRLLVADAENEQVRVYDFTRPAEPSLLSSLNLSGTPVLLAGGDHFGLVAVATDSTNADTLDAVAPALPDSQAEYLSGWGNIDIGKHPRALALSPNSQWGIVVTDGGFTLLHINDVGNIDSIPVEEPTVDAVLSDTTAYLLGENALRTLALDSIASIQVAQALTLDGSASLVALNPDNSQGAIVVDGARLVFFDPASMEATGSFDVEGAPITSVHYLGSDDTEYVVITQQDSPSVAILNTADPQSVSVLPAVQPLDRPVTALAVHGPYMIATDGVTIRIFSS